MIGFKVQYVTKLKIVFSLVPFRYPADVELTSFRPNTDTSNRRGGVWLGDKHVVFIAFLALLQPLDILLPTVSLTIMILCILFYD